ncbi:MAG TPA: hypothetical protein VHU80_02420 [Polyangiaceae bacterium]|nr:hypothetical protein [Polyangiaceae bacterium]
MRPAKKRASVPLARLARSTGRDLLAAAGPSTLFVMAACATFACSSAGSASQDPNQGIGGASSTGGPTGTAAAGPVTAPTATGTVPTGTPTAPIATSTAAPTGTGTPPAPTGTTTPSPTGTVIPPAPTGTGTSPSPTGTGTAPPPMTGPALPSGATRLTLTTTPFMLDPGEEAFKCQNFANTTGKDIAVIQASATMAKGSHHMFVFYDPTFDADVALADCSGTEFHDFLILTQSPEETQTYPAGVGRVLKSNNGFRAGMHYLNTTPDPLMANVSARFDYVDTTAVQHLAAQMELNQGLLAVPPGTSTQSHQFAVPYDISLIYAISHMHKQATHFKAATSTQTLYETTVWDEPVPKTYDPPIQIPANSTITYACDYNNGTGMTLTFGESAQKNEMCIFFGVFYATQPSSPQGQGLDQLF